MTDKKKKLNNTAARMAKPRDLRWHPAFSFRVPDVYVDGKLKADGPTLDELLQKKIPSCAAKQNHARNHARSKHSTGLLVYPRTHRIPGPDVYVDGKRVKPGSNP